MNKIFQQIVAWALTVQVLLIGALGTGLHDLLGCQHGACGEACCSDAPSEPRGCGCCGFCQADTRSQRPSADRPNKTDELSELAVTSRTLLASCADCALCDLLDQFHQAAPTLADPLEAGAVISEAELLRENAVIAASIRLAHSRGPPLV